MAKAKKHFRWGDSMKCALMPRSKEEIAHYDVANAGGLNTVQDWKIWKKEHRNLAFLADDNQPEIVLVDVADGVNKLPVVFNKRLRTYENLDGLPVHKGLTVYHWHQLSNEIRQASGAYDMQKPKLEIHVKEPYIYTSIDLSLLAKGILHKVKYPMFHMRYNNDWFKTDWIHVIHKKNNPFSLSQIAMLHVMTKYMKGKEGMKKFDLRTKFSPKKVPHTVQDHNFYEIIYLPTPTFPTQ